MESMPPCELLDIVTRSVGAIKQFYLCKKLTCGKWGVVHSSILTRKTLIVFRWFCKDSLVKWQAQEIL